MVSFVYLISIVIYYLCLYLNVCVRGLIDRLKVVQMVQRNGYVENFIVFFFLYLDKNYVIIEDCFLSDGKVIW